MPPCRMSVSRLSGIAAAIGRGHACLGSLGGKAWLIGVGATGDLSRRRCRSHVEDHRRLGCRVVYCASNCSRGLAAGQHFVHDECLF